MKMQNPSKKHDFDERDANERRQQGDDRDELPNACADAKRRGDSATVMINERHVK